MSDSPLTPATGEAIAAPELKSLLDRTPARVLCGRVGPAYPSRVQLELRRDHALALDAVHATLDLVRDFGQPLIDEFGLFEVSTRATTKEDYLRFPTLGRRLNDDAQAAVLKACPKGATLQIVIGDGLSATAAARQVPQLLPRLTQAARDAGWSLGQPFVVRFCRVGVLNDVGDLLNPEVVVLLIGERPGLATAESLSAYLAFRPRPGHTDAQRNLISNIHERGVTPDDAVRRIMNLAAAMRDKQCSGVAIKEP